MTDLRTVIDALAARAAELSTRPHTVQEKRAMGMSDVLTSIGSNPAMSHALLGSAIGAGVGGARTAIGNIGKDDVDKRSIGRSLLTGGLAGGALGGGIGLARQGIEGMRAAGGVGVGDALSAGQFVDANGVKRQIDPKVLKANPGLVAEIERLNQKPGPIDRGIEGVLGGAASLASHAVPGGNSLLKRLGVPFAQDPSWMERNLPETTNYAPKIMLLDAILNSRKLKTGDMNPLAWASRKLTGDNKTTRWLQRNASLPGMIDPRNSTNVAHMREGVLSAAADPKGYTPEQGELLRRLKADGAADIKRMAHTGEGHGETWKVPTEETRYRTVPQRDPATGLPKTFTDPAGKVIELTQQEAYQHKDTKGVTAKLTPHETGDLKASGVESLGKKTSGKDAVPYGVQRSRLFGDQIKTRGPLSGGRGLARLLGYGAMPAGEYLWNLSTTQDKKEQDLRELMEGLAKPVVEPPAVARGQAKG